MNTEDRIQASVVDFIRTVAPQCLPFHCPNGGLRTKAEAARFKWLGVVAGIPDLIILIPGGRVATIEVKAPGGTLSPEQREIRDRLITMGIPRAVCRSIDDARMALAQWQVPTREAVPA